MHKDLRPVFRGTIVNRMVNYSAMQSPQLDKVFFALSDPTRRAIVGRLAEGSTTVGKLAAPFKMSAPAVSKHMKILEQSGLVIRTVKGREHHCRLSSKNLQSAEDWLKFHREFWNARLDKLESLLTRTRP